jgi:hypothetical protein
LSVCFSDVRMAGQSPPFRTATYSRPLTTTMYGLCSTIASDAAPWFSK